MRTDRAVFRGAFDEHAVGAGGNRATDVQLVAVQVGPAQRGDSPRRSPVIAATCSAAPCVRPSTCSR